MGSEQPIDPFVAEVIYLMPPELVAKLDESERRQLRQALGKGASRSRHSVDIRLRIPLFFTGVYFVLQAGVDRRTPEYQERRRGVFGFLGNASLLLVCGVFLVCTFAVAYLLKCSMGIDLFPIHLKDVIPSFLGGKA